MSSNVQRYAIRVMHCLLVWITYLYLALAVDQTMVEADNAAFCGMSLRQGRRQQVQKAVLPTRLSTRLTSARVVAQMEDRAVCTDDVELTGLRYGSESE